MKIELSIGNVIIIGLSAFLAVPFTLLAFKYAAKSSIPVVNDIGTGAVNLWRVAA